MDRSETRTIDYVVIALHRLGGSSRSIDIEDIAFECFNLAPHRFRWRKYADQIDIAGVRDGLSDARKVGLLVGDRKHGWTLTDAGRRWAEAHASEAVGGSADAARLRLDVPVRAAERQRVLNSRAWAKLKAGEAGSITAQEVRELLRIDRYVSEEKHQQRVAIVTSAFADSPEDQEAIWDLDRRYREKM
jgi:hypothetical protein